jgi:predicted dehydrogenase
VTVAVPAGLHFEVAAVALERGFHCFIEKPFTRDVREAEALVRLAEDKNLTLMAGHLLLHQPAIIFLKKAIDDGMIGELLSIHAERLNLGRAQGKESVLWSKGLHDISVALYLVGEAPDRVVSTGTSSITPGIEDDVYVHMEFPSGVMANLHCSWLWPTLRRRTVVIGTKAMLVYSEVDNKVFLHRKTVGPDRVAVNGGDELVFEGQGEPLRKELEHFFHCIREKELPRGDGQSAVEVLRVIEAASR